MGTRWVVLGICILSASGAPSSQAEATGNFSVASLTAQHGVKFEPTDVVFIQQYYSSAPKFFLDDVAKKEKALPPGAVSSIALGKPLPKELIPFMMNEPASVTHNLQPLSRGMERKVLGARFLLLEARQVVRDMVHLPTAVATQPRK